MMDNARTDVMLEVLSAQLWTPSKTLTTAGGQHASLINIVVIFSVKLKPKHAALSSKFQCAKLHLAPPEKFCSHCSSLLYVNSPERLLLHLLPEFAHNGCCFLMTSSVFLPVKCHNIKQPMCFVFVPVTNCHKTIFNNVFPKTHLYKLSQVLHFLLWFLKP